MYRANVKDLRLQLTEQQDRIIDYITIGITDLLNSITWYWIGAFLVLSALISIQLYLHLSNRMHILRRESEQRREKITNWLTTLDFAQKQKDILDSRSPDTGTWLLNSTEFSDWLFGSEPALWLNGIRKYLLDLLVENGGQC